MRSVHRHHREARLTRISSLRREGKAKVMAQFNDNLTAKEQKWLIRIILKDLKISLGEKMVLSCMHQDAIDLFNVCSDLRAVAWKLWDPTKRLPTEVCPFRRSRTQGARAEPSGSCRIGQYGPALRRFPTHALQSQQERL